MPLDAAMLARVQQVTQTLSGKGLHVEGSGLEARRDVVGKVAPDDLAGGGLGPPLRRHVGSTPKRLERAERFLPCGACLLFRTA